MRLRLSGCKLESLEPRHRQADPPALAGRLPDGRAAPADGARHQGERRGLPGDERRGVCPALLLRPRRARRARRPARLAARRVHRRGALHAPLGALLPAPARPRRRRARGAPDLPVPARGPFRLCGAAAARAAEPRARALGRRAGERPDGHRGRGRGARSRLHPGAPGPARQARGRDLEAADGALPVLVDRPRRRARADGQPLRPASGERHLVRDRARPGGQRRQELPRLAHPLGDPVRDAAGARLPGSGDLRRRGVPRARGVAVRRHGRRGAGRACSRHGLVGGARVRRRAQPRRGRRLRDRVRLAAPARALDPAPGRPRGAARALPAPPPRDRRASAQRGARTKAPPPVPAAERRRALGRIAAPSGRQARLRRSGSASSSPCSPTCSPPAARSATPSSRRPS